MFSRVVGGSISGTDSVALPASTSSRYGLSVVSALAALDGRRPRPRRGGRRLSLMLMVRKKRVMPIRRSPKSARRATGERKKREMRDGKKHLPRRGYTVGTDGARGTSRDPGDAGATARPGPYNLRPQPLACYSGVRRGRAGGRQEYRHFSAPAQPSKSCRRARRSCETGSHVPHSASIAPKATEDVESGRSRGGPGRPVDRWTGRPADR